MSTDVPSRLAPSSSVVAWLHAPLMVTLAVAVVWAAAGERHLAVVSVVVGAVALTFLAERLAPYDADWNRGHDDSRRDVVHVLVNEALNALSVAALPLIASSITLVDVWPSRWPFAAQVLVGVIVFDAGVTLAHWWSHRSRLLWSFHAVHHSVQRFYGLNGLMKHPLHQAVEMTAGVAPLVLLGLPQRVAVAIAGLTVLQLLVQHANVAYRVGPLGAWWAVNAGHRLHHLRYPGEGDVNFGLYTLVWDRLLGTYVPHSAWPVVATADVGVAGRPDYPAGYLEALAQPFRDLAAASPSAA